MLRLCVALVFGAASCASSDVQHRPITIVGAIGHAHRELESTNLVPEVTAEQRGTVLQVAAEIEPLARTYPVGLGLRLRWVYTEAEYEAHVGPVSGVSDGWRSDVDVGVRAYFNNRGATRPFIVGFIGGQTTWVDDPLTVNGAQTDKSGRSLVAGLGLGVRQNLADHVGVEVSGEVFANELELHPATFDDHGYRLFFGICFSF